MFVLVVAVLVAVVVILRLQEQLHVLFFFLNTQDQMWQLFVLQSFLHQLCLGQLLCRFDQIPTLLCLNLKILFLLFVLWRIVILYLPYP